jgi:hypothetical protein
MEIPEVVESHIIQWVDSFHQAEARAYWIEHMLKNPYIVVIEHGRCKRGGPCFFSYTDCDIFPPDCSKLDLVPIEWQFPGSTARCKIEDRPGLAERDQLSGCDQFRMRVGTKLDFAVTKAVMTPLVGFGRSFLGGLQNISKAVEASDDGGCRQQ